MSHNELPQSDEAERSVLGSILVEDSNLAVVAEILTADDFYRARHQHVFSAMLALAAEKRPVDLLTLHDRLKSLGLESDPSALSKLMDGVPRLVNAAHYATIVKERSLRRTLVTKGADLELAARGNDEEVPELVARMVGALSALDLGERVKLTTTDKLLEAYMDNLQARQERRGGLRGLDSGFESLNERTGGLPLGGLSIIAARPSAGKSALSMNVARHVARTASALVVQLEVGADEFMERLISSESGVDSMRLKYASDKSPLREHEWGRVVRGFKALTADMGRLRVHSTSRMTVAQVGELVRRVKEDCRKRGLAPLRLVVIDYLQLMEGRGRSRQEEVASISRGLKVIAQDNQDVALLACCQVRRADPKTLRAGIPPFPTLDELKESGQLEQDGDLILAIQRKEFYLRLMNKAKGRPAGDVGDEEGWADVGILKQRQGPTGRWRMRFWAATTTFGDPVGETLRQGEAAP